MTTAALVTGITGQDGGYLAERLVGDGVQVHGILRPGEGVGEPLTALSTAIKLHEADLADERALATILHQSRATQIFNLAGVSSVAASWQQPALAAEVNGTLVARLLQLAWDAQEERGERVCFVQASSAEIFAGATATPQDESTPVSPRSPYGASKAFAHHMCQVFRARGLHASNAILYNHESPRRPTTFVTRKITSTVAAIARGEAQGLTLGNLEARRDWGWAPDYVDALVRMSRHHAAGDFVVATGAAHSVGEFVAAAFQAAGIHDWESLVTSDPALRRPIDATELRGDPRRAYDELGWVPTVSFEGVVERMVHADLTP